MNHCSGTVTPGKCFFGAGPGPPVPRCAQTDRGDGRNACSGAEHWRWGDPPGKGAMGQYPPASPPAADGTRREIKIPAGRTRDSSAGTCEGPSSGRGVVAGLVAVAVLAALAVGAAALGRRLAALAVRSAARRGGGLAALAPGSTARAGGGAGRENGQGGGRGSHHEEMADSIHPGDARENGRAWQVPFSPAG